MFISVRYAMGIAVSFAPDRESMCQGCHFGCNVNYVAKNLSVVSRLGSMVSSSKRCWGDDVKFEGFYIMSRWITDPGSVVRPFPIFLPG